MQFDMEFELGIDSPVWPALHHDPKNILTLDQLREQLDWYHIIQRFEAWI